MVRTLFAGFVSIILFSALNLIASNAILADAGALEGIWHNATSKSDLSFEQYKLGSNSGQIVLDGKITCDDGLGLPFKRQSRDRQGAKVGTPLTGWVKDDGDNLYISLDISMHSKVFKNSEHASVFIKQPGGIKEYRFGKLAADFVASGHFETLEGKRKHKVFEFKIPLKEISVDKGNIELAFSTSSQTRG